ncbi:ATP-binding protein [Streptomyces sp. NPDC018045]|uniref:ATP-binding protein n=1 Tax=Streptomyces sp. NPDC018045 TaxID=3365037 RepID=UPI00379DD48A
MKAKFPIQRRLPHEEPASEDSQQVSAMRHRAHEVLVRRGLVHVADEAELVVCELITNAIQHSGGREVTLSLALREGFLQIVVSDGGLGYKPRPAPPGAADEHGRGLFLVQAIADGRGGSWGTCDAGAATWCELGLAAG